LGLSFRRSYPFDRGVPNTQFGELTTKMAIFCEPAPSLTISVDVASGIWIRRHQVAPDSVHSGLHHHEASQKELVRPFRAQPTQHPPTKPDGRSMRMTSGLN
ncbi:hypothetical protein, partial [Acidocella sp.]|uniref:hypothetical protein n=1 Tax=Acidocella sp. TaxID=50710 RepID=UPI002628BE3B